VDHQLRRTTLADRLGDLEVEALFVTRLPNVRYLTGFTGSNGQALVTASGSVFFTDGRYTEQSRHEVPDLERVTYATSSSATLREQCERLGVARLGFEAHDVSVAAHARMAEALDGIELVATQDAVERGGNALRDGRGSRNRQGD
jgi:Xaa-Pro aminopeptidase